MAPQHTVEQDATSLSHTHTGTRAWVSVTGRKKTKKQEERLCSPRLHISTIKTKSLIWFCGNACPLGRDVTEIEEEVGKRNLDIWVVQQDVGTEVNAGLV